MKVSEWKKKANKLKSTCESKVTEKNGSKPLSGSEVTSLQAIQTAIGSKHGKATGLKYSQALTSLNEMYVLVNAGSKTPPLIAG